MQQSQSIIFKDSQPLKSSLNLKFMKADHLRTHIIYLAIEKASTILMDHDYLIKTLKM